MSTCGQMLVTNQAEEVQRQKHWFGLSSKAWEVLGAGTCFPKENVSSQIQLDREASGFIKCSQNLKRIRTHFSTQVSAVCKVLIHIHTTSLPRVLSFLPKQVPVEHLCSWRGLGPDILGGQQI